MPVSTKQEEFTIELKEKSYLVKVFEKDNTMLYQVRFGTTPVYLTMGTDRNGNPFWTSIPADTKLSQIVQMIGEQIDNHFK